MLNFRKLKQDFSPNILTEGRNIHYNKKIISAKIIKFDNDILRINAKISGNFENAYESEIEIDRFESQTVHSNCDCTYRFDCQHVAALVFYLEEHLDSLLVKYSSEADFTVENQIDEEIIETLNEAKTKEKEKKDQVYQKQVLEEYVHASNLLAKAPFFLPKEQIAITKAEPAIILNPKSLLPENNKNYVEFQLAMRLPFRSKPLHIPFIKDFLHKIKHQKPMIFGSKKYHFSLDSFSGSGLDLIRFLIEHATFLDNKKNDRIARIGLLSIDSLGMLFSNIFNSMNEKRGFSSNSEDLPLFPHIFVGNLENALAFSFAPAQFRFDLEYIEPPASKLLINPTIIIDKNVINLHEVLFFKSIVPGMLYQDVYYRFNDNIERQHLNSLLNIRDVTIPEPLFGTFVENSLPEIRRYGEVENLELVDKFVTIPHTEKIKGRCELSYVDGELDASLYFIYEGVEVHSISNNLSFDEINNFVTKTGILARNLVEENKITDEIFQDFVFNQETGGYIAKTDKVIVEFMTEIIPKFKDIINFECPQNLLDQFIYDKSSFTLDLDYNEKVGFYNLKLNVNGDLLGVSLDRLWECLAANRFYIELTNKNENSFKIPKILVLDLKTLSKVIKIFDELGIKKLENVIEEKPLWTLVNIDEKIFKNLPVKFRISDKLKEIRKQMLGEKEFEKVVIPKNEIHADLRSYQKDGVFWLNKLNGMYLNGILADDMGLGKTLQAIIALALYKKKQSQSTSIIVCPTSLLHNWKEEFSKFNPSFKVLIIDGIPNQRKKLFKNIKDYDVIITSYTLMQKDVEFYKTVNFGYCILDEAQHIKNRGTRNAKSVKMINAAHKLILTGTPIENSLDEMWSLFDFLMPGFLSSYDRFIENYVKTSDKDHKQTMEYLKKKVSPFILRRMKTDVLKDLPPVDEISYHCKLSNEQLDLYKSYAKSAKEELSKLVEKEGFDKVQIHVLATLTRLKQICCHPAIFAKEKALPGDSAKYEMLLELLQTLVEGKHKTVIFSQYTKMLQIMKNDFERRGIKFSYLDGSSKNRLEIVKEFNQKEDIPVFLVSLKAGGTGLNITGADTVIHYDMWWNPAVENQATDRVHRIGQKKSVSCYKLVTLNTIEEKILELQNRKKGLVKKIVNCDDEAIAKLTWEDVLELLQT